MHFMHTSFRNEEDRSKVEEFNKAFKTLIPIAPAARSQAPIYLGVLRALKRSGLKDYSPLEILTEVWEEGVKTLEKGNTIRSPDAWIYSVALRIVAKKVKQVADKRLIQLNEIHYDSVMDSLISSSSDDFPEESEESDSLCLRIRDIMQQLDVKDREILEFHALDNWDYADIAKSQADRGENPSTPAALRQRKSRAVKKFKALYRPDEY